MRYEILYFSLYVWVLIVVLLKMVRKEKVHWLWYVTIALLTLVPIVVMYFTVEKTTMEWRDGVRIK